MFYVFPSLCLYQLTSKLTKFSDLYIDGVLSFFPLLPVGIQVPDTHMKIRYNCDHLTPCSGNIVEPHAVISASSL